MSFGEAFNRARQLGVSNFGWDDPSAKYGSYGTGFKPAEEKSAQQQEMEYNDRAVENVRKKGGFWNTILSGIMSNTNYPMK
jgi:hypothetical protein